MEPLLIAPCYSLHFYQIFFEKITDCYHIFYIFANITCTIPKNLIKRNLYEINSTILTDPVPAILENFVYDGAVWDASHSYFTWRGGYFKNAKMGDANGDDMVTISDVMGIVKIVLGSH